MELVEIAVVDSGWTIAQTIGTWLGALGAIGALIFFALQTRSLTMQTRSLIKQTELASNQTVSMMKSFEFDSLWRRQNKSSELARFYAERILPCICYCSRIVEATDIYQSLRHINPNRMIRFNRNELEELLGKSDDVLALVKESVSKVDLQEFLYQRRLLPVALRGQAMERLLMGNFSDLPINKDWHKAAEDEFWFVVTSSLNDLEHFSMCINCGIADGKILYPSLHQTFFAMISAFYFLIAYENTSMKDKFYTHIIQLFTDWKELFSRHEQTEHMTEDLMTHPYQQVL